MAPPYANYHTMPTGGLSDLSDFNVHQSLCTSAPQSFHRLGQVNFWYHGPLRGDVGCLYTTVNKKEISNVLWAARYHLIHGPGPVPVRGIGFGDHCSTRLVLTSC
ncbi:hypothetical protein TNCV_1839041 [Trichonephila clavipes]|nr:hypothetical protein TNCV_1839041 [Trichonephila clavipes]